MIEPMRITRFGRTVGYICNECGEEKQSLFGGICKRCRAVERRHQEILSVLREKKEAPDAER